MQERETKPTEHKKKTKNNSQQRAEILLLFRSIFDTKIDEKSLDNRCKIDKKREK